MTPDDLDAALVLRRARLAESAAQQVVELRAKQRSGEQRVGPWAPAATIAQPKPKKLARSTVQEIRRWA